MLGGAVELEVALSGKSSGLIGLVRAESLRGRAHSRLARPAELWSVSLSAAWWVSGVVVVLLAAALLALPVSQSYMGSGYVASSQSSGSIIRSSVEGSVRWIAVEGDHVIAGGKVAEIDRGARTDTAYSALDAARAQLLSSQKYRRHLVP